MKEERITITLPESVMDYVRTRMSVNKNTTLDGAIMAMVIRDRQTRKSFVKALDEGVPDVVASVNSAIIKAMDSVANTGVTHHVMVSSMRFSAPAVYARKVAWVILRGMNLTYQQIATAYGRNHASIMNGVNTLGAAESVYQDVRWLKAEAKKNLGFSDHEIPKPEQFSFIGDYRAFRSKASRNMDDTYGDEMPSHEWTKEEKKERAKILKMGAMATSDGFRTPVRHSDY